MFKVLEPARMGRLELRNRFARSATWDALADETGAVTDGSLKLYEELARGGVALISTGYAFVSRGGQATHRQYGIHTDEMIPGLRRLAEVVHNHGAKIVVQIVHSGAHSGYLARTGQEALAPSKTDRRHPHRAMTEEEIEGVIGDFAAAAVRAREAGFDGVQLHGAHGYLMSQFLSTLTNLRQDRWGGSAENRRRFHVETVRRARGAIGPDFPLTIKLGIAGDGDEGGTTMEEGIDALKAMVETGLDAAEISGELGGRQGPIQVLKDEVTEETYYRARAAAAKRAVSIPVTVVGGIRCLETAEDIVTSGDADFIAMSRAFIREPDLVRRWLSGDHRRVKCISCSKCLGIAGRGEPLECGEERRIREEQGEAM